MLAAVGVVRDCECRCRIPEDIYVTGLTQPIERSIAILRSPRLMSVGPDLLENARRCASRALSFYGGKAHGKEYKILRRISRGPFDRPRAFLIHSGNSSAADWLVPFLLSVSIGALSGSGRASADGVSQEAKHRISRRSFLGG